MLTLKFQTRHKLAQFCGAALAQWERHLSPATIIRPSFRWAGWSGLLGLAVLVQIPAAVAAAPETPGSFPQQVVRVKATSLMVRQTPGTTGKILTHVGQGQEFASQAQSSNGWHQISIPYGTPGEDRSGWLSGSFLEVNPASAGTLVQVDATLLAQTGSASLRVRSGPGITSSEIAKVWGGQSFVAFGTPTQGEGSTKPWYKIHLPASAGANEGWLAGDYLVPAPGAVAPATPAPAAPAPAAPAPVVPAPVGPAPDTKPPTLSAFSVQPTTVVLGEQVSIAFTVSDTGGAGLGRVALWRTVGNGAEDDPSWTEIIATNLASFGHGPVRLLFSDATAPAGVVWYELKVCDSAAPVNNTINTRQAGLGPKVVVVQAQKYIPAPAPALVQREPAAPATNRLNTPPAPPPDDAGQRLAQAQTEVAALQSEKQSWQREKEALNERVQKLTAQLTNTPAPLPTIDPERLKQIESERETLRKNLADAEKELTASRAKPSLAPRVTELETQIAAMQAQTNALQSEKQDCLREKTALNERVQKLTAQLTNTPAPLPTVDPERLKQVENEREALRKKLADAEKELAASRAKPSQASRVPDLEAQLTVQQAQATALRSERDTWQREKAALEDRVKQLTAQLASPSPSPRVTELESKINTLQARLSVCEAPAVPYTAEELALFKAPALPPPDSYLAPKTTAPPSADVTALLTEARGLLARRQLDQAESKFMEVVRHDGANVEALARAGAIQMDLHRMKDAETHLQRAYELAPTNVVSLAYLGRLRLEQTNYNESINLLSRAAQLLPEDADIQIALGLALSGQGQRKPAETALRKAVTLKPSSSYAHFNLAVVYLGQQPPFVELARWHYQKARALGLSADAKFEKMMEEKKAAAPSR